MKKDVPVALVIENPILLLGFQEIIDSLDGFKVIFTCTASQEFLDGACHNSVDPQICLLDIPLHNPGTPDMMDRILAKWPLLKILLLSPFGNAYCEKKALAYGAAGFITTSSSKEVVHRALVNLRFTGQYFESQLQVKDRQSMRRATNSSVIENKMMSLLCTEMDLDEIAQHMNLDPQMIEESIQILFKKFSVTSRVGLAVHAYEMGLVGV